MVWEHTPVLKSEVIKFLAVRPFCLYIDTTVGGGGHAEAILRSGGVVLGIDADPEALKIAEKRLVSACPVRRSLGEGGPLDGPSWRLVHGNFNDLAKICRENNFFPVEGILFDLGISTMQLKDPRRGFSFGSEAPLDMRMDPQEQKVTAADLINGLNEGELYELFTKLGEEHHSRRLARAICRARRLRPIKTGEELARLVLAAIPVRGRFNRLHPATRVFQALRLAVNDELNNLRLALPQAEEILTSGGRLVVLSFHSLEDRIVKNFLKEEEIKRKMSILTQKPVGPTREEVVNNPSARSGKLRAGEKI